MTMSAGDVLVVVAATVVTMLVAVLAASPRRSRTLRDLRDTANALHDEAVPLLEAARDAVNDAAVEVDRVERLVTSAERLSGAVDGASRIAAHAAVAGREGDGVRHRRVARRATVARGRAPARLRVSRRGPPGEAAPERRTKPTSKKRRPSVQAPVLARGRLHARHRLVVGGHAPRAPDRAAPRAGRRGGSLERQREVGGVGRAQRDAHAAKSS